MARPSRRAGRLGKALRPKAHRRAALRHGTRLTVGNGSSVEQLGRDRVTSSNSAATRDRDASGEQRRERDAGHGRQLLT